MTEIENLEDKLNIKIDKNRYIVDDNDKIIYLELSNNQITDISEISKLTNLTSLYLSNNQITDISEISKLTNLTSLYLSNNQITDISEISKLTNLTSLYLYNNQITDISEISKLTNLTLLYLSNNQITDIPFILLQRFNFKITNDGIVIDGFTITANPLVSPPYEILEQGEKVIRSWFDEKNEKIPLREAKMIFIGEGGVGKTSLMHRLIDDSFNKDEKETHGVNIEKFKFDYEDKSIKINIWDFGGQHMQHSMHRIFFTSRTLYIVMLDHRKEDKSVYWLEHIKTLAKNSPVLVVINKCDSSKDRKFSEKTIRRDYPNIKANFFYISSKTSYGLSDLRNELKKQLANLELINTLFLKKWMDIKHKLEKYSNDGTHHISLKNYELICDEYDLKDKDEKKSLLRYLNDLGDITWFEDDDINSMQVLNPEWITNGVYSLLTSEKTKNKFGQIAKRDFKEILGNISGFIYKEEHYNFLISIMKKFYLCYEDKKENHIIIPPALKPDPQIELDEFDDSLIYRMIVPKNGFMPSALMHMLISKLLKFADFNNTWNKGIIFSYDENNPNQIMIIFDENTKELVISIKDKSQDHTETWRKITNDIYMCVGAFSGLEYDYSMQIGEKSNQVVELKKIKKYIKGNQTEYFDPETGEMQQVNKLYYNLASQKEKDDVMSVIEGLVRDNEEMKEILKIIQKSKNNEPLLAKKIVDYLALIDKGTTHIQNIAIKFGIFYYGIYPLIP
jgi:small GTP-binding protein